MKKRILSLALIIGLFASFSICAYAQSETEFTPENPDYLIEEGVARGANRPTTSGTLPYTAKVTDLAASKGTYTNRHFLTSTGTLNISGSLESRGTGNIKARAFEIQLYNTNSTSVYDSYTGEFVSSGDFSCSFNNLDKTKNWYIKFVNISDSSSGSSKDISGSFTITK